MKVVAEGGNVSVADEGLDVTNANAMTVYLYGATNFSPDNDDYIYPAAQLPFSSSSSGPILSSGTARPGSLPRRRWKTSLPWISTSTWG